MDKGGPRTLHDLSCQFGAKGFTREMRQIAGGSQSGLKKFLGQHPSLFYICGDYVRVNTFEHPGADVNGSGDSDLPLDSNRLGGRRRDYAKEAVDYFSEKLLQYGVGTQVPIKSLLGHRSQASPEVRHISGQHVKEFRDFLIRHPQDFVVREGPDGIGETVSLRIHEGSSAPPVPFKEHEEAKVDPEVTRRLLEFAAAAVTSGSRGGGPITLERLFRSVSSALPPDPTLQNVLKTPQDLSTFLRIHSDAFHLQANLVTLVPGATVGKASHESPSLRVTNVQETQPTPVSSPPPPSSISPRQSLTSPQQSNRVQNAGDPQARSLKQRVNSLVMKTIADNSEKDRGIHHGVSGGVSSGGLQGSPPSAASTDAWKMRVIQSTRIVSSVKECLQVVDDIMRGSLGGSSTELPVVNNESPNESSNCSPSVVVSFDCEGVNLGARGSLSLFQIGLPSGQAIIFDLLTSPPLVTTGGLQKLLESDKVVKVIHDCRNDSINLFNQFGITLQNVFDTQAAHAILQLQETGRPVHKAKNLSLNALCMAHGAPPNPLKESLKGIYRRDQRYWNRRPLTRDMIIYAAADVLSLIHVYCAMQRLIQPKWEPLLQELCEEQILMNIRPSEVKQRKKQRKVEAEVADLRQKLDSSSAMPSASSSSVIVLSNREIRLLRYLDLTEEEKERLKGSYKVARKLEKLESLGMDRDSKSGDGEEDDEDYEEEEGSEDGGGGGAANGDSEYPSLDSIASGSGKGSPDNLPLLKGGTTLTESMQLVDEILSDNRLDRTERIERLEAVLSSAVNLTVGPGSRTDSPSSPILSNSSALQSCHCSCHLNGEKEKEKSIDEIGLPLKHDTVSASCQTLSTGDIVITRIYFTEEERERREKGLAAASKK